MKIDQYYSIWLLIHFWSDQFAIRIWVYSGDITCISMNKHECNCSKRSNDKNLENNLILRYPINTFWTSTCHFIFRFDQYENNIFVHHHTGKYSLISITRNDFWLLTYDKVCRCECTRFIPRPWTVKRPGYHQSLSVSWPILKCDWSESYWSIEWKKKGTW